MFNKSCTYITFKSAVKHRQLGYGYPSHVYIQKFNEIKDQYSYCTPIYTDGSKDNDRIGCGLVINNLPING